MLKNGRFYWTKGLVRGIIYGMLNYYGREFGIVAFAQVKESMKHKKPYDKSVYRTLVLISQCSINMLVPICMMTLLGLYLDRRLGTGFWMIILFFVGAVAGVNSVYRLIKRVLSREE